MKVEAERQAEEEERRGRRNGGSCVRKMINDEDKMALIRDDGFGVTADLFTIVLTCNKLTPCLYLTLQDLPFIESSGRCLSLMPVLQ